jgi:hypothetical protein
VDLCDIDDTRASIGHDIRWEKKELLEKRVGILTYFTCPSRFRSAAQRASR